MLLATSHGLVRSWWSAGASEGEVDEGFFFELVGLGGSGCRAGGGVAFDAEDGAIADHAAELGHDVGEGTHVGGLFLHPDDFAGLGMLVDGGAELGFGKGIELLEEEDADGHVLALFALDAEIVADLAGGDDEAAGSFDVVVGKDVLEMVDGKVGHF